MTRRVRIATPDEQTLATGMVPHPDFWGQTGTLFSVLHDEHWLTVELDKPIYRRCVEIRMATGISAKWVWPADGKPKDW